MGCGGREWSEWLTCAEVGVSLVSFGFDWVEVGGLLLPDSITKHIFNFTCIVLSHSI